MALLEVKQYKRNSENGDAHMPQCKKQEWWCRLQQLEGNQAHLAMDLQSMKGMGALMVGWRDQMETASAHLAAVLGLVERDGKAVRYSAC